MTMIEPLLLSAGLAGLGVALGAAPLGCFVVWRRMAYFGDAIAHGAILGVALALAFSVSLFGAVLMVTLTMALIVAALSGRALAVDTLLGVLAHGGLALGLVAVSFVQGVPVDLMAYLFGDILAVGPGDLWLIWVGAALVAGLIGWRWQALLVASVSPDLAIAAGIRPGRERLVLMLALALLVALAIKVVGVLLISAMLIIPAAAARPLVRTPEAMAMLAAAIGAASALGGLALAFWLDSPAAPTMVSVGAGIFALSTLAHLVAGQLGSRR